MFTMNFFEFKSTLVTLFKKKKNERQILKLNKKNIKNVIKLSPTTQYDLLLVCEGVQH